MEPSMNRSALFVLLASATVAYGAQAHTYTDNARVLGGNSYHRGSEFRHRCCREQDTANWERA